MHIGHSARNGEIAYSCGIIQAEAESEIGPRYSGKGGGFA